MIDWLMELKESSSKQDINILNLIINETKEPDYSGSFTKQRYVSTPRRSPSMFSIRRNDNRT